MVPAVRWGPRASAGGLAIFAGCLAVGLSVWVFPYHSVNHDEAVYLQQAAMLLEGHLFLSPPIPDALRPWFFVRDGARLYPKYAPVPAAIFAVGGILESFRLTLGLVAATAVGATYAAVAEAFDGRRGLLAAGLLVASPLFLVQSAVFLPYLPTATLNLLFADGYLRADRTGSRRWAAIAGIAIGLAFFARPYTAVVFAAPFVGHAVWTLRERDAAVVRRQATTATLGSAGVVVALAYNAVVTGSPLLFPYEAFAPLDGLGFGRRALLGYSVTYTPGLAIRANAEVLWTFFVRWVVAGPIGAVLAVVGLGATVRRVRRPISPETARRLVLIGLAGSVIVGNLYFWGNLNVLGRLSEPGDGLIHHLGPYYHVDLLLPTVAFASHGIFVIADTGRRKLADRGSAAARSVPPGGPRLGVVALVLVAGVFGGVSLAVAAAPISDNREATAHLATAYEPIERADFEDAVVLLPTPHGPWLNHPFQALRNDPEYDGPVVYAIDDHAMAVADAFPDRTLYRYSYRGIWSPATDRSVEPRLREVRVVEGDRLRLRTTFGVPSGSERVAIRLASGNGSAYYVGDPSTRRLNVSLLVDEDHARLQGPVESDGSPTVTIDGADTLTVEAFVERPDGGGVTYRVLLPIESNSSVRAISPHLEACLEPLRCGGEATYVPNATPEDVVVETELTATPS